MTDQWFITNDPDHHYARRRRRIRFILLLAIAGLAISFFWALMQPLSLRKKERETRSPAAWIDTTSGTLRLIPFSEDGNGKCFAQVNVRMERTSLIRWLPCVDIYSQETVLVLSCRSTRFRGPCNHYTEVELHDELVRFNRPFFESQTSVFPHFDFDLTPGTTHRVLWSGLSRNLLIALLFLGLASTIIGALVAERRLNQQLARLDQGRCPKCAYKLLPDQFTCSECGHKL